MASTTLVAWTDEECERIHDATLTVLRDVGVDVKYEPAIEALRELGARVEGQRVFLDEALVARALETAPSRWEVQARSAQGTGLILDNDHSYFGTGSDCLYFADPAEGRRRVRLPDVEAMAALCEKLEAIDFVMSMGLPEDVPRSIDDLAPVAAMLRNTSKPIVVAPRDGGAVPVISEMAAACGERRSIAIYAMPSPPLMHDADALSKLIACAELEVPVIYAPAPAAGASAPATIAATVIVGNAEVLSGLVVHQGVRPGAPFVYGAGYSALNMRTMVDCYAVPEHFRGNQAGCDLARHYALPSFSYAAVSDSKVLDEQCAAEYGMTTILGALSGATLLHDVGYFESGLQSSLDSIVLAAELIGWARGFTRKLALDDWALALDEIALVGPGGNHLARSFTRKHYGDVWRSTLLDQVAHDRWHSSGAQTLKQRLRERTSTLTEEPRAFQIEPAACDQLAILLAGAGRERESDE